jgi:hypothetical protein
MVMVGWSDSDTMDWPLARAATARLETPLYVSDRMHGLFGNETIRSYWISGEMCLLLSVMNYVSFNACFANFYPSIEDEDTVFSFFGFYWVFYGYLEVKNGHNDNKQGQNR